MVASRVAPTYRLTYEEVDELLSLGLDEEPELRTLLEEAHRRHDYRYEQVGDTVLFLNVCLCASFPVSFSCPNCFMMSIGQVLIRVGGHNFHVFYLFFLLNTGFCSRFFH